MCYLYISYHIVLNIAQTNFLYLFLLLALPALGGVQSSTCCCSPGVIGRRRTQHEDPEEGLVAPGVDSEIVIGYAHGDLIALVEMEHATVVLRRVFFERDDALHQRDVVSIRRRTLQQRIKGE